MIDSSNHRVIVVKSPGTGADTKSYYPFWRTHLIIDLPQNRCNFLVNRTNHKQDIRLSGGKAWETRTKPVDVIVSACHRHIFHATAGGYERVLEDRILAGPTNHSVEPAGKEATFR
jgi:hypothetical protein